ncbi:putative methionine--tRNA ligase, partial [Tetrabaena socialis]
MLEDRGRSKVGLPAAQTLHFCSLLRWVDLLQNTADAGGFFTPRLALAKPRYVSPPPPPPPAPKPAKPAVPADAKKAKPDVAAPAPAGPTADAAPAAPAPDAGGADAGGAKPAEAGGKKKEGGKKEKEAGGKKEAAPPAKAAEEEATIDLLDCRVGRIVKVEPHPNADALYLEQPVASTSGTSGEIHLTTSSEGVRGVASVCAYLARSRPELGAATPELQAQVAEWLTWASSELNPLMDDKLAKDRVVVVVCNLKPAKMRDVMSYGMVLCASDDTHGKVEPVLVPEGVPLGERLTVEGPLPALVVLVARPDGPAPLARVRRPAAGTPVFKGKPFLTSKGPLSSSVQSGWV